jgi:NADPH-dependent curcumin reductase CurA
MVTSRAVILKSRPVGMPLPANFAIVTMRVPPPRDGQVQVRNLWMSVDPYMRSRMNASEGYMTPFELGQPMSGGAVGIVVTSNDPSFNPGDLVLSMLGWREYFNAGPSDLRLVEALDLPVQAHLGIAGMTGLTAYAGLLRIANVKRGETVLISGAAGAVGSAACQIAKIKGCTVIGTAGGAEKVAYLEELGVDHIVNYKSESNLEAAIHDAAPNGIDVYFDNVGGIHLEAALSEAKNFARFVLCGMISQYNSKGSAAPHNLFMVVSKSISMHGFLVRDHYDLMKQFKKDVGTWFSSGQLHARETVERGLDNAVSAFLRLFEGGNLGKMLVKLG